MRIETRERAGFFLFCAKLIDVIYIIVAFSISLQCDALFTSCFGPNMPPKKTNKIKSEVERERLEADAEERERRLTEEERSRVMQIEAEQKRAAECINFRKEEVDQLIQDYDDMKELFESNQVRIRLGIKQRMEDEEWDRCKNCNVLAQWPGINEPELNEYLSTMEARISVDFQRAVDLAEFVKCLIDEIVLDHLSSEIVRPREERKNLLSFVASLQSLVRRNIDSASSKIILHREKYIESDGVVRASSSGEKYGVKVALWMNSVKAKGARPMKVIFEDVGISIDIPKSLVGARVALRFGYFPLDYANVESDMDGDIMFVAGTMELDILDLSPSANKLGHCTIRQIPKHISSGFVLRREYPFITSNAKHSLTSSPIRCNIEMPSNVVIDSDCRIARISENETPGEKLTIETAHQTRFDETNRILSFSVNSMGKFALLQTRCIDYSYFEWCVFPISSTEVIYSIKTRRFLVKFVVQGLTCKLVSPDLPELSDLKCREYKPAHLLGHLSRRGIHLMPVDRDAIALNITRKKREIANRVYQDISTCAFSFHFQSSRYNDSMDEHEACYQAIETGIFAGVEQRVDDEKYIVYTENDSKSVSASNAVNSARLPERCGDIKCSLLRSKESASKGGRLDMTVAEDMRSSMHLFPSLQQISTPEASRRILDGCPLTSQTINDLLGLTKPIDFTSQ